MFIDPKWAQNSGLHVWYHRLGLESECWGVPTSSRGPFSSNDLERKKMLMQAIALEPFVQRRRLAIE